MTPSCSAPPLNSLGIYSEEAQQFCLQVNWTKTKCKHIGDVPDPPPLQLANAFIEPVKSIAYLGSIVTANLKPEITCRRALAATALQSLRKPLWRHQNITRKTMLQIYNSAVVSILLYGSEIWPLNQSLATRMDGFGPLRTSSGPTAFLTKY